MDTSISDKDFEALELSQAWGMRDHLLGLTQTCSRDVPPPTWLMIWDFFMGKNGGVLGRTPGIFVPISDLMSGENRGNNAYIRIPVPRRRTSFQEGTSPTTRVFPGLVYNHPEASVMVLLLVSQKEQFRHLVWATWSVTFDEGGEVATSEVRFVDSDFVCELFGTYRGVAHSMLDSLMLSLGRAIKEQAKVVELFQTIERMFERLK